MGASTPMSQSGFMKDVGQSANMRRYTNAYVQNEGI
jgi:hypothetical protein